MTDSDELMTTAQAAKYCGFKTSSAIRKAKMEGRLKSAGKRGGIGTFMYRRTVLDQFLMGKMDATFPPGRPVTPHKEATDGQNSMEETVEPLGQIVAITRSMDNEERRSHCKGSSHRPNDRQEAGTSEGIAAKQRPGSPGMAGDRKIKSTIRETTGDASKDALRRLRARTF